MAQWIGGRVLLRELFNENVIALGLTGQHKDEILRELVSLLKLDDRSAVSLLQMLRRREELGSTGVGRGIAIPHCRTNAVDRVRVGFGRRPGGIDFQAMDGQPVRHFFLIVAPPLEVSNLYLPVLGRIAQLCKERDVPARLDGVRSAAEFLAFLEERGV